MQLQPIVDRLISNVPAFVLVGGSADIPSADQSLIQVPAAFVVPQAENASPNSLVSELSQLVTVRFAVLIAVRNVSDSNGSASLTDLDAIRRQVKTALLAWQSDVIYQPITFVSGALVKFDDDAVVWWLDTFETSYFERVI